MHARHLLLFTTALVSAAAPALAADTLLFGKAPDWATHQAVPAPPLKHKDAPLLILLSDTQTRVDGGKLTQYSEVAFKIQTALGLAAGNISLPWSPDTDTVTVNKLEIRRGDQVIDVLASGQKFTTIRRESNLEAATLDGILTANIQPEGLQVGDIIFLATTQEHFDPVMKGHVETNFAAWNGAPIRLAHASLDWPQNVDLMIKESAGLPTAQPVVRGGRKVLDLTARDVEPLTLPKDAPARFSIGRIGQATDFKAWADVASLMKPLFLAAAVIPASGPLHDEVEKIRASSNDPKVRAEKALDLVQSKVRYVALLMGQGSYVPANAETTWARRFGDCKAKTALLTAMLRSFGIQADPVAVQSSSGDAVPSFLPSIGVFNHVLVRAQIGSKTYWLDGTRTGDKSLDNIVTPSFHWGLPLIDHATLVPIMPEPLSKPDDIATLDIDASGGVRAPAPAKLELVVLGDDAVAMDAAFSRVTATEADQYLRENAKEQYDFTEIKSATFSYDEAKREFRRTIIGDIKLNWRNGWYRVPHSGVGFDADFERPAGPNQEAPFAISFPQYASAKVSIRLPAGFTASQPAPPSVDATLAGVTYRRTVVAASDRFTLERSTRTITSEIPYKDALAATPKLKALDDEDVHLRMPRNYNPTPKDLAALSSDEPSSAFEYIERGGMYVTTRKYDAAIKDFTEANRLEPKNAWALANRAIAYAWTNDTAAAKKDADAALAIESDNWVAHEAHGLIAEFAGHPGEAVKHFDLVLQKNPDDGFTLYHHASNAIRAGELDLAEKDLKTLKDLAYDGKATLPLEAQLALARGNFPDAVKILTTMVAMAPEPFIYMQRANAYHAFGEDEKALADTAAGLKLLPSFGDLRLLRINILRQHGRKAEVAREADLLVKNNKDEDSFGFVAAARTYAALGDRAKAMSLFDEALKRKQYGYIYLNRAQVRPKDDEAGRTADINKALELDPAEKTAIVMKISMLADEGKYNEALAALDKLSSSGGEDNAELDAKRTDILAKAGKSAEAEAAFAKLTAKAKSAVEYNNLCWGRAIAGVLLEPALAACKKAVELAPQSAAYQDSLGMAYLRLNKFDESLAAYNKALATRPRSAESLMGRALALVGKGDLAHARADAKTAREQDPDIEETFEGYGLKFADQNKLTSK
jgi:tetratricopeptide (TPR) repeat protein